MKTIIKSLLSTFALVFIFIPNVNADGHSYTIDASNVSQYADMLSEGSTKKAELEQKLLEGASPGMGDNDPALFIVG